MIKTDEHKRNNLILLIALLILPNLYPSGLGQLIPASTAVYNIGSVLSFLVVVAMIATYRRVAVNYAVILVLVMELWLSYMTVIFKSASLKENIFSFTSSVTITLIIYHFSDRLDEVIEAVLINFEWLIYASLISVILYYPDGMYIGGDKPQYFLGHENGIIFYAIPAMFAALVHMKKEGRYLRGILLIAACLANILIVWCATAIVGIAVAGFVVFIAIFFRKPISYYMILICMVVADIVIVFFQTYAKNEFLAYVIQHLLEKSLTFTGRTKIWKRAMELIPTCLWTGMGRGYHVDALGLTYHAHNQYLELLLEGGIPLLVMQFIFLIYIGKKLGDMREKTFTGILVCGMTTLLLVEFIAQSRLTFRVYVPLTLAAYVMEIETAIQERIRYRREL